jgi:nucleoside-diphosphate-sugar epimerase
MKILVTGAGGFLGKALVRRLLDAGETDLRLFVRPGGKQAALEAIARQYPRAKVEYVVGTLTDADACARAVAGVDVVQHLAAGVGGAAADLFLHSVVATKRLLDAMIAQPRVAKLVLTSSFSVYGVAALGRGAMVDESTPLEPFPEKRDTYAQSKLRQEKLCWEYHEQRGVPLVVVRPGVIYGPGGGLMSGRVGLDLFGVFLHLGRKNVLPLVYVDNCADALIVAMRAGEDGGIYNAVDDDLPTAAAYLRRYRKEVRPLRVVRLPWIATMALSAAVERYNRLSEGQLPAVFTPYKTRTVWGGNRFSNARLKAIGWTQAVSTTDGIGRAFAASKPAS